MTAKLGKREAIRIEGWRAEPDGYAIHSSGSYNTYRGWANNKAAAIKWLKEASGLSFRRLPPIRLIELTIRTGERQPLPDSRNRNDYYQHTYYYDGDKLLGTVQIKCSGGRVEALTCADRHGVIGRDLRWMCQQHGLRLVDE